MIQSYLVEEACARLRYGLENSQWTALLAALEIDPASSAPDFAQLIEDHRHAGSIADGKAVRECCGCISLDARLSVFGEEGRLVLRYVYVGDFGYAPDEYEGFGMVGSVAELEQLTWADPLGPPAWQRIDMGGLSPAMLERIDTLVLEQEREKFEAVS